MTRRFVPIFCLAALASFGALAADAGYKQLKLQDLLGASWPEFASELDSLLANPKNEDAFYRMYKIAQRADAESKVPQYLFKLSQDHPEKSQIKTLLGMFYRENRDYPQAIKYFREGLLKSPDDYFIHYQLAHLLGKQDGDANLKESIEHYTKAVERIGGSDIDLKTRMLEEWGELVVSHSGASPEAQNAAREHAASVWDRLVADERRFDRLTYEHLGQLYERHEMWAKAASTFRACLENAVEDDNAGRVRILDRIGDLSEHQADFKAACAAYNEALALVDENHWLHKQLIVKLAKCRKKLDGNDSFVTELDQESKQRQQSTTPLRDLALAYESLEDKAATIRALERARTVAPKDVTLISDLLLLYAKTGGPEAAVRRAELYRTLIELMPENFDAYVGLADVCWELGDAAKTQDALKQLQDNSSTPPEKYLVMARAFRKYGMNANARNAFERALADDPANLDAAMELCDFCLENAGGNAAGSEEPLQRAVEIRSALMSGHVLDESGFLRLMQVFQSHKRLDDASDIIGYAATNVFPKSFICRFALAELHYARKEFYKAIQHYVAALDLAPSFYFKRVVNDRIVTLTYNYGRRTKDFMSEPGDDEKAKGVLGGTKGEGLAPWIFYLQALVSSNPQNADNMMLLAQINESAQVDANVGGVPIKTDAGRARALYKSVVDMDLKNLDAHAALARTYVMTDEFEAAIQENWILEQLSPVGKWQYIMNVGDLWAFAGYGEKALQNWNTVREQATTEPNLVYQLGSRMYQLGKLPESTELVRKAAAANRSEFRFHSTLGNLLDEAAGADPERFDEAIGEYRTAVDLATQNAQLRPYLLPVQRRLLNVQLQSARAFFTSSKFIDAARVSADALTTAQMVSEASVNGTVADLKALRGRALLAAGKNEEGEALLKDALTNNTAPLYWYDADLKLGAQHMLALFTSGRLSGTAPATTKQGAGFHIAPQNVLAIPALIESATRSNSSGIYLKSLDALYRVAGDGHGIDPLKLQASGALNAMHGDHAVLRSETEFSLFDIAQQSPVWKKEVNATGIFMGESLVACFYTRRPVADASRQPAGSDQVFLKLIERNSGRDLWEVEAAPGDVEFAPEAVIVKTPAELLAFKLADGSLAWKSALSRDALWRKPQAVGKSIIIFNELTNELSAYDLQNGMLKFTRALGAPLLCDPVVISDTCVAVHILRRRAVVLQCLDVTTGRLAWESTLQKAAEKPVVPPEPQAGKILREFWTGIEGGAVENLTAHSKFSQPPDGSDYIETFSAPVNWGDNYGQRIRGYFIPPATGKYTFFISSDDGSELWLSSDSSVDKKEKICGVPGYTAPNEYTKYPEQKSNAIQLTAGKRYYIEALHKEGAGGDHISVGCKLPDGKDEMPIAGAHLAPVAGGPAAALPPPESLEGISLPPVQWHGWLLHLDPSKHRIWAAKLSNGDTCAPVDLAAIYDPKFFVDTVGWGVSGDTLYIATRSGRIALAKLMQ